MELKFYSIKIKNNKAAVYYDVTFEDENGNLFEGHAAQFHFDLKQVLQPIVEADAEICDVCGNPESNHCLCDARPDDI